MDATDSQIVDVLLVEDNEIIDACFMRLAEPALPCENTDFRDHPVLGSRPETSIG